MIFYNVFESIVVQVLVLSKQFFFLIYISSFFRSVRDPKVCPYAEKSSQALLLSLQVCQSGTTALQMLENGVFPKLEYRNHGKFFFEPPEK